MADDEDSTAAERKATARAVKREKLRQWREANPDKAKQYYRTAKANGTHNKPRTDAQRARATELMRIKRAKGDTRTPEQRQRDIDRSKAWMAANKETKRKAWRAAKQKRLRETASDWWIRNREKILPRLKQYRNEHRDYFRAKAASRRRAPGTHTAADIAEIRKLQKNRCAYCKTSLSKSYRVDHHMPIAKGGTNDRKNLQLLCHPCNAKKHAKHPVDFAQQIGLLL